MNRGRFLKDKISSLSLDLALKKDRLDRLEARRGILEDKISSIGLEKLENASIILQKLSERQREAAKIRLEELGTQALQHSMGDHYRMIIEIGELRKRPTANLYIYNEKTDVQTSPLDDNGGGIVDIISIALRLVVLQAHEPPIDGPIIMDEPFKMVSKEYVPMLSEFLKKISQDFGRQIIMVTHNEFLAESCTNRIEIS